MCGFLLLMIEQINSVEKKYIFSRKNMNEAYGVYFRHLKRVPKCEIIPKIDKN